jgi:hypothetical protein
LGWFNEEQRELFDILELDNPPYTFQTVAGEKSTLSPINTTKIKSVTYQDDATADPQYLEGNYNADYNG